MTGVRGQVTGDSGPLSCGSAGCGGRCGRRRYRTPVSTNTQHIEACSDEEEEEKAEEEKEEAEEEEAGIGDKWTGSREQRTCDTSARGSAVCRGRCGQTRCILRHCS